MAHAVKVKTTTEAIEHGLKRIALAQTKKRKRIRGSVSDLVEVIQIVDGVLDDDASLYLTLSAWHDCDEVRIVAHTVKDGVTAVRHLTPGYTTEDMRFATSDILTLSGADI